MLPHTDFVKTATTILNQDQRLLGLAIGGSWMSGELDEFSDLDFYVVLSESALHLNFEEKRSIIAPLGKLLGCYHNGHDARVIVSLYEAAAQLLHVDWKWISLQEFEIRVENPNVLFEREGLLSQTITVYPSGGYKIPEIEKEEIRFWTWMHYVLGKIGRGEIIEAFDYLCEVRSVSLGPLLLHKNQMPARRMRHAEQLPAQDLAMLQKTIPTSCTANSCLEATINMMQLFKELRQALLLDHAKHNVDAERACLHYAAYISTIIQSK